MNVLLIVLCIGRLCGVGWNVVGGVMSIDINIPSKLCAVCGGECTILVHS